MKHKKIFFILTILLLDLLFSACTNDQAVILKEDDMVSAQEENPTQGQSPSPEAAGEAEQEDEQEKQSVLFVHICGAVNEPGVYELPGGSRVYEAVAAAGGFTQEADEDYVNQVLLIEDGSKLVIPTEEETKEAVAAGTVPVITAADQVTGQEDGLVDINTADIQTLCTLPGIGTTRAEAIIACRESRGGFSRIEDIMEVEGIKEGTFNKLKDKITVR